MYAAGLWWTLGSKICRVSSRTWALKLMMLTHHATWLSVRSCCKQCIRACQVVLVCDNFLRDTRVILEDN